MQFDWIAFDADDTLWHSENVYHDTQAALTGLLARYGVAPEAALDTLHRIEIANLPVFGYGIKGFTISMVEAAVEASGGRVSAADIQAVVEMGRRMASHEIHLLAGSAEAVARLAETHPLMLITKGDLLDQERKLNASGLLGSFQQVEIVSDKTPAIYERLLKKHRAAPERFLMVGNSLRSDILPVLELGGWAVYVPYALTWAHEAAEIPKDHPRLFELENLAGLPDLIARLEQV